MRHHAQNVAFATQDAGDIPGRAIAARQITKGNAIVRLERVERAFIGMVVAFSVSDRKPYYIAFPRQVREGGVRRRYFEIDVFADKLQICVAEQGARKNAALDQNLKSVAYTEYRSACGGEVPHRGHYGRELRYSPAAEIVPVGEAARQNHTVHIAQLRAVMPDELGRLAQVR